MISVSQKADIGRNLIAVAIGLPFILSATRRVRADGWLFQAAGKRFHYKEIDSLPVDFVRPVPAGSARTRQLIAD